MRRLALALLLAAAALGGCASAPPPRVIYVEAHSYPPPPPRVAYVVPYHAPWRGPRAPRPHARPQRHTPAHAAPHRRAAPPVVRGHKHRAPASERHASPPHRKRDSARR